MNHPCFLLDENLPHRTVRKLLRQREPNIQVWVVGQPEAPALSAADPELLAWIELKGALLVTRNRASMPVHLADHLRAGQHVPGILVVAQRMPAWQLAAELYLIWGASLPHEFQDQIIYLPLKR